MDNLYGTLARIFLHETAALKRASLWTIFMVTLLGFFVLHETAGLEMASL